MSDKRPREIFILGTSVEITVTLSIATATTAKITIFDPSLVIKINAVNLTKQVDKIYSYIYQSTSTDLAGVYPIQVEITSGGYTSIFESETEFRKQVDD